MKPIVSLEHVEKRYGSGAGAVRALALDLTIHEGELVVVAGPSGSGKTTLLNLVGALDRPTCGRVVFEGRDLSTLRRGALAELRLERIGFIFQDHNLLPVLDAEENADLGLVLRGIDAAARAATVRPLLAELGIGALARRRPYQLSGGQRQRVAVARALAGRPALVLADEPTASLDSATGEELMETLAGINRQRGTAFLIASHDPMVMSRARRLVRLRDGHVEADGPP